MALVYLNSSQFREDFDQTDKYIPGRRLKIDCGVDGVFYTHTESSSYNGDVTTVTVADSVVTSGLTSVQLGVVSPGAEGTLPVHTHESDEQGGALQSASISDFDTAVKSAETVTALSLTTNILTYVDEAGTSHDIDLSLYLDDTNLARLTSGTLDGATGIATFTRDDATTFTVDFSALLDDTQVTVEDVLTSTSTVNALSANQGRVLNVSKLGSSDIGVTVQPYNAGTVVATDGVLPALDGSNLTGVVPLIEQPTIISPQDGATGILLTPTITFSPYYSLYGKPQQALRVQVSTVSDFATTVADTTLGAVSEYTPSSSLSTVTEYFVRGMYQDDDGTWSDWTPTISFTTTDIYIDQPTITNPTNGSTDVGETPTFTTGAFACVNGTDTHESSSWYLYRTSDEMLVWSSVADTANLTSITLPAGIHAVSTGYRLEAIHTGTTYGDSTKGTVTYTTAASFFDWGPGDDYDAMVAAGNYDSTTDTGYMGLVTSANLTDGPTLATDIGLSAGVAFNNTAGWLKFYVGPAADCNKDAVAKVLFIAKETIRHTVSWDDIYLAGAVYGTGDNGTASASTGTTALQDAQVIYGTTTYKVRLLTGSATDPAAEAYNNQQVTDDAGGGTEWNDLLYRVHTAVPTTSNATIGMDGGSETTRHGGPQDGANWATYTNAELQVFYTDAGDGTYCWCQEQGNDTTRRVLRGYLGVADFLTTAASSSGAYFGWRPVLEVVQA